MKTTAIVCTGCRRIIAVGAKLPAMCLAAVPAPERRFANASSPNHHTAAHTCMELEIIVPSDLGGQALLDEATRAYAEPIDALASIAADLNAVS